LFLLIWLAENYKKGSFSMRKTFIRSGLAILLLFNSTGLAIAAEKKMTREEYEAQLAEYNQREAAAVAEIATCTEAMAALKQKNKDSARSHCFHAQRSITSCCIYRFGNKGFWLQIGCPASTTRWLKCSCSGRVVSSPDGIRRSNTAISRIKG
jgi:hypothetical protein